ncbi:MAG: phosphoglycerate kinase [bacterium]
MNSIKDLDVSGKKVFLRVDFNVPLKDGKITDNNRVKAAIPTIEYLAQHGAKIIIGTHLGRPDGKPTPESSTLPVAEELAKLIKHNVIATDHILGSEVTDQIEKMKEGDILVLGNLRWHPEEEKNDEDFGKALASYADLYVNDAFAVSHRANASVESITHYLPSYGGFLMESEITTLGLLFENPESPFVVIIGGAKVKDKAGVIKFLAAKADRLLIGGAVANTFLLARGEDVGQSLIEEDMIEECKGMLDEFGSKIVLPIDYVKKEDADGSFSILDIGEQTRIKFGSIIKEANALFINGNLGYTEEEAYQGGTKAIVEAIRDSSCGVKVAAGGDTVGYINKNGYEGGFSFISTGGGAALELLAGEKLPGVEALN